MNEIIKIPPNLKGDAAKMVALEAELAQLRREVVEKAIKQKTTKRLLGRLLERHS